jgi:hypothetical protein
VALEKIWAPALPAKCQSLQGLSPRHSICGTFPEGPGSAVRDRCGPVRAGPPGSPVETCGPPWMGF